MCVGGGGGGGGGARGGVQSFYLVKVPVIPNSCCYIALDKEIFMYYWINCGEL